MSRLPRNLVWYQWFGTVQYSLCPVCCQNMMERDASDTWHREHILRLSLGGPDTYPNLIPICPACNLGMGKDCRSTFEYMARTARLTAKQARHLERQKVLECRRFDPQCEQQQKNGSRCANLKGGKNELYCWKHIRPDVTGMDLADA